MAAARTGAGAEGGRRGMLTRLEADGFLNLVGFAVDFGPCTCIAGPNGAGKSNLLDAIRFLSLLADHPIREAALRVRGGKGGGARIEELFHDGGGAPRESFRLAAEMLVEPELRDDFGRPGRATSTFLRYELEIGRAGRAGRAAAGIELRSESLRPIRRGEAGRRLRFPHSKAKFRDSAVRNRRFTRTGYVSTLRAPDGSAGILVHQDGGAPGPAPGAPARGAPGTVVGTTNSVATPTVLAARREMQRWRRLSPEPAALRRPDRRSEGPAFVSERGAHLAAALGRLQDLAGPGGGPAARVAARLAELAPVSGVEALPDPSGDLLTLSFTEAGGRRASAGATSEGVLRFLALALLAEDPEARGLLCIEAPEQGLHPGGLPALARLVRDLAVDPRAPVDARNPLRQIVLTTHSPVFLRMLDPADLLVADRTTRPEGEGSGHGLRCRPLAGTWRAAAGGGEALAALPAMSEYLPPSGAQLLMAFEAPPRGEAARRTVT